MTVLHSGATMKYADNFSLAFGKGAKAGGKSAKPGGKSAKAGDKSAKPSGKASSKKAAAPSGKAKRDRKSTRLNSSHIPLSRMPSSA